MFLFSSAKKDHVLGFAKFRWLRVENFTDHELTLKLFRQKQFNKRQSPFEVPASPLYWRLLGDEDFVAQPNN